MHAQTTSSFLKTKLYNLRRTLWLTHGANEAQLDLAEKFLVGGTSTTDGDDGDSLLVKYACSLHNQSPESLRAKATTFVQFCGVPEKEQEKAAKLIVRYMDVFLAVVNPGD
jgi:hypothetical protein